MSNAVHRRVCQGMPSRPSTTTSWPSVADWMARINRSQTATVFEILRLSLQRRRPFGEDTVRRALRCMLSWKHPPIYKNEIDLDQEGLIHTYVSIGISDAHYAVDVTRPPKSARLDARNNCASSTTRPAHRSRPALRKQGSSRFPQPASPYFKSMSANSAIRPAGTATSMPVLTAGKSCPERSPNSASRSSDKQLSPLLTLPEARRSSTLNFVGSWRRPRNWAGTSSIDAISLFSCCPHRRILVSSSHVTASK